MLVETKKKQEIRKNIVYPMHADFMKLFLCQLEHKHEHS
jgi:hypothetical protein